MSEGYMPEYLTDALRIVRECKHTFVMGNSPTRRGLVEGYLNVDDANGLEDRGLIEIKGSIARPTAKGNRVIL